MYKYIFGLKGAKVTLNWGLECIDMTPNKFTIVLYRTGYFGTF